MSKPQNETEEWRSVVGYETAYEVSNFGRVRRIAGVIVCPCRWGGLNERRIRSRVLVQIEDKGRHAYGRLQVKLSLDGEAKTRLVAHLVLEAFVGPRPPGMEAAHNDGNVKNNRASNLRYDTPAGNTADKALHGTILRGQDSGTAKLSDDQVREIKQARGRERGLDLAKRFGVSIGQISRIQTGKRWRHANV